MPRGIYKNNNPKYRKVNMKVKMSGPVIFRERGYDIVRAITVYVGKKCGYRTITPKLMVLTIEILGGLVDEDSNMRQKNS